MAETISIRIVDDSPAQPAGSQSTVTDTGKPVTESPAIPAGSVVGTMPPMGYVGPNVMPVGPVVGGQVGKGKVTESGEIVGPNVVGANDTNARTLETLDVAKRSIETAKRETIQPDASRGVVQNIANNTVNSVVPTTGQKVESTGVPTTPAVGGRKKEEIDTSKFGYDAKGYLQGLDKVSPAAEAAAKSMGLLTKGAYAAGDLLAGIAGNERMMPGQIVGGLKDVLATPLKMLPGPAGAAVGMGSEVVDAILKIPDKLAAAFLKQAEKLAPMSGSIAVAQANADIKTMMADFREAQQMGESYGKLIDAQNKLDLTMREILLPLKRAILDVIVRYIQFSADNAEKTSWVIRAIGSITGGKTILASMLATAGKGVADEITKSMQAEVDRLLGRDKENNKDGFREFFRQMEGAAFSPDVFSG